MSGAPAEAVDRWAPFEPTVPSGWAVLDFGAAFEAMSVNGKKVPASAYLPSGSYPVIDQGESFVSGYSDDATCKVEPGDGVLVFGDHTRRFKLVRFPFVPGADGIKVLRPLATSPEYAYYASQALRLPDRGYSRHYGFLVRTRLPVPPEKEQQRIVSRIEELFSEIDEGERALERVGQLVERYRQSVLKAAVTGELTREWRERHAGVSVAGVQDQFSAARAKTRGRSSPVEMAEVETLPELPESWAWTSLDAVADVVGGITVDKKRSAEGCDEVPYLRVANVQRGFLDLAEVKTIVAPRERIEALRLAPGDILFNEGGDIDKLGRGWLWQGELPVCIHQNHVFRARLFVPGPWNKLISWFGNVLGRRLFMDMGKQTTNLASLSLSKLKSVPVPLMSHQEAVEIVSRAEDALSIIDKCIVEVARQRRESSALRQSILKAAFSGQLVPQDPNDEPASALLARLAAQSAAAPPAPKRRGRKEPA